jgi:hypothetical protein
MLFSSCSEFHNFANIDQKMKKILIFALLAFVCVGVSDAAVRDAATRAQEPAARSQTAQTQSRSAVSSQQPGTRNQVQSRAAAVGDRQPAARNQESAARNQTAQTASRAGGQTETVSRGAAPATARSAQLRNAATRTAAPAAAAPRTTVARAAADAAATSGAMSETRTGAEYERCKSSYFTCMDQFCKLKNDDYRRCSCSDRVYDLDSVRGVMRDAGAQLTEFTEGLDSVGMTASQAAAMRTASEGENALTSDGSASKALLQAIMNSIRGGDANVGGKFSELNSINLSFDTANAFGMTDAGQAVAAYNGKNLYTAIYGQCRSAVKADCNNASLQRAITAYLMAIEQDCNTVQASVNETKKSMTAAVREGGAMLDLARVENRQKHNSDDMTACLANVEQAVLSSEVCGPGYRKCLDNGEFIDLTTGAPITGVVNFYELEHLLTFDEAAGVADQKLSKISNNRSFVLNFEKRVKKFAQPALDKCVEKSDDVWSDYLDKAMLDIYYSQKAKVSEIKQGCFDFVSSCYVNGDGAMTAAMSALTGDPGLVLQPDRIALNSAVCRDYVASCDGMFDGNIVQQYVDNRKDTDVLAACRAVVKQCFDKFGGSGYQNFYYPSSGLFKRGEAADWFTLCVDEDCGEYKSECARQLREIKSCSSKDMITKAFGGFDILNYKKDKGAWKKDPDVTNYGIMEGVNFKYRELRPVGVATEVYYQIIDTLNVQCNNVQGRFVELQFLKDGMYEHLDSTGKIYDNRCLSTFAYWSNGAPDSAERGEYTNLVLLYDITEDENMCPKGYRDSVDTESWGICSCWENGARRSEDGASVQCVAKVPYSSGGNCPASSSPYYPHTYDKWCTRTHNMSKKKQVCPLISAGPGPDSNCSWTSTSLPTPGIAASAIPLGM